LPSQMEGMHLFALSDGGNAPICPLEWRECTYLPSQMEGMHLFALLDGGNAPICPLGWRECTYLPSNMEVSTECGATHRRRPTW